MFYIVIFAILMLVLAILELIVIFKLRNKIEKQKVENLSDLYKTPQPITYKRSDIINLKTRVSLPNYVLANRNPEEVKQELARVAMSSLSQEIAKNMRLYKIEKQGEFDESYLFEIKIVSNE